MVKEGSACRGGCAAVCAIIHAAIEENNLFSKASVGNSSKLKLFHSQSFSDEGVSVAFENGMLRAKIHVNISLGHVSIPEAVFELQQKICEEVTFLTSYEIARVDIIVVGLRNI